MKFKVLIAGAAVAMSGLAAPSAWAQALPVTGGLTTVKLSAAPTLAGAGVSTGLLGTATLSPGSDGLPIVYFPVTGGSLDTGTFAGTIEHDGSGLALTRAGTTINLRNFVIDTATLALTGDVSYGSTTLDNVALFSIGLSANPLLPFTLSLTSAAGGALAAVLGIPDLTGAQLGLANTAPVTAVPEPSTLALMLAGVGIAGLLARRKPRRAA